jgi:MarR family transcriptional regulator, organic hydroperoxide resistance regulator
MTSTRDALSTQVFGDMVRVIHAVSQEGARRLAADGLTPAQFQLMAAIDARPGSLQQDLADGLGVTKGNVSMLVSRLVSAGLAERDPDGAAVNVRLTRRGTAVLRRLRPRQAEHLAAAFGALDDDELRTLAALVRRIGAARV